MFGFKKFITLFRADADPGGGTGYKSLLAPHCDAVGNVWTRPAIAAGSGGAQTAATGRVPSADGVAPATVFAQDEAGFIYGYVASTGNWNRLQILPDNADGQAVGNSVYLGTVARLQGWNGGTFDRIGSQGDNADGVAVQTLGHLKAAEHGYLFNETTWDRQRGSVDGIALASAVRNTGTFNSPDIVAYNARGILCFVNITAVPGGGVAIAPAIQFKDPASGVYYNAPGSVGVTGTDQRAAAVTAVSSFIIQVGNVNTAFTSSVIARTWRVSVTHSAPGNFTYSVGYSLMY